MKHLPLEDLGLNYLELNKPEESNQKAVCGFLVANFKR